MILNSSQSIKRRKLLNGDGEPIYPLGDIDDWSNLYQKQDDLEKLRLYYTLIGWRIVCKVYPKHEMIKKYEEIIVSPEFLRKKLLQKANIVDDISESLSALGHIPQYHLLANEQCPKPIVKVEVEK